MIEIGDPKLLAAVNQVFTKIVRDAPKKTGNLAFNAIRFNLLDKTYRITVSVEIAPYMRYTEFRNRSRGWWRKSCRARMKEIAAIMGGKLRKCKR